MADKSYVILFDTEGTDVKIEATTVAKLNLK